MKTFPIPSRPFRQSPYSIKQVASDEFGVVPGAGWVILRYGKRVDWPMLTTEAEAQAELIDFRKMEGELASDEASERFGLARMGAC